MGVESGYFRKIIFLNLSDFQETSWQPHQHTDPHPCTRPGWSRSLSGWFFYFPRLSVDSWPDSWSSVSQISCFIKHRCLKSSPMYCCVSKNFSKWFWHGWWPLMVGRASGGQTLGNFYWKHHAMIGLKAPGSYSAPDWFNKIPILLF